MRRFTSKLALSKTAFVDIDFGTLCDAFGFSCQHGWETSMLRHFRFRTVFGTGRITTTFTFSKTLFVRFDFGTLCDDFWFSRKHVWKHRFRGIFETGWKIFSNKRIFLYLLCLHNFTAEGEKIVPSLHIVLSDS